MININGALKLKVNAGPPPFTEGFYESMLILDGVIQLKELHLERLRKGLSLFALHRHRLQANFEQEILKTAMANGLQRRCMAKLQVYAGAGDVHYSCECSTVDAARVHLNETGLNIGIADWLRKNESRVSSLKVPLVKAVWDARKVAEEHRLDDMLFCNSRGNIVESGIANVFWIKNEIIYTPPLSEGCIGGVMRSYLLGELPRHDYTVREDPLSTDELLQADEVFLCNAVRRIKWVRQVRDRKYGCRLTREIYKAVF